MLRIFLLVVLLLLFGFGLSSNFQHSFTSLKKEARDGNSEANFKLGIIYFKGDQIKQDLVKAMKYFQRAAVSGHIKAKYNTGVIYANKNYQNFNYKKAFEVFSELSALNHPKSKYKLGIFLLYGLGVDKDYKKAVKLFEEAYFAHKDTTAGCYLALMYASGKGVFPNFGRAREVAQEGFDKKIPICIKVYNDFNLEKYHEDKGFKFGFYK